MKKINFSDKFGLTEAVLSGRKTQTRRICKEQYWSFSDIINANENQSFIFEQPKYKVGEVVAVAQSYMNVAERLAKKAYDVAKWMDDHNITKDMAGWLNKMFVKASLMIFKIRITNVKLERLRDISEADCVAEGVEKVKECEDLYRIPIFHKSGRITYIHGSSPRAVYAVLIDRISGRGTFESNPWVFVYDFELVK